MKLSIELVPKTCWFTNVRSNVSKAEWDTLRKACYKKAGYRCEICGGVGENHPVECHEIWEYNDEEYTQTLKGLIALCPNCHKVKHPGLAGMNGDGDIVIKQLMKVNGWKKETAFEYLDACFEIWERRSRKEWKLDISYLNEYEK